MHTSSRQLAAALRQLPRALEAAAADATAPLQQLAHAALIERSSGTLTAQDLAQLDHPYARRHGRALRDSARINRRTGRFAAGWEMLPAERGRGVVRRRIVNRTDRARWMHGTRYMVERPLTRVVALALRRRLLSRLKMAIRSTWKRTLAP